MQSLNNIEYISAENNQSRMKYHHRATRLHTISLRTHLNFSYYTCKYKFSTFFSVYCVLLNIVFSNIVVMVNYNINNLNLRYGKGSPNSKFVWPRTPSLLNRAIFSKYGLLTSCFMCSFKRSPPFPSLLYVKLIVFTG